MIDYLMKKLEAKSSALDQQIGRLEVAQELAKALVAMQGELPDSCKKRLLVIIEATKVEDFQASLARRRDAGFVD